MLGGGVRGGRWLGSGSSIVFARERVEGGMLATYSGIENGFGRGAWQGLQPRESKKEEGGGVGWGLPIICEKGV